MTLASFHGFFIRCLSREISRLRNDVRQRHHHEKGELHWHFQIPGTCGLRDGLVNHPGTMRIGITATADNATPGTIDIRASIKCGR